jgi:hypothetical protein
MSFLTKIFGKNVSRYYNSPIDKFIAQCDHKHPQPSLSQQQEITKANKITYLRDHAMKEK